MINDNHQNSAPESHKEKVRRGSFRIRTVLARGLRARDAYRRILPRARLRVRRRPDDNRWSVDAITRHTGIGRPAPRMPLLSW